MSFKEFIHDIIKSAEELMYGTLMFGGRTADDRFK
jgi:hypothetical protein